MIIIDELRLAEEPLCFLPVVSLLSLALLCGCAPACQSSRTAQAVKTEGRDSALAEAPSYNVQLMLEGKNPYKEERYQGTQEVFQWRISKGMLDGKSPVAGDKVSLRYVISIVVGADSVEVLEENSLNVGLEKDGAKHSLVPWILTRMRRGETAALILRAYMLGGYGKSLKVDSTEVVSLEVSILDIESPSR